MLLSANVITLLLLSSLPGILIAEDPVTSVEAISLGSTAIGGRMDLSEPLRGSIGSGELRFSATGDCSLPIDSPVPDACGFDFASLQGSGEMSVTWQAEGKTNSLVVRLGIASSPNQEIIASGASDSFDIFVIWDLKYEAVLTVDSSSSVFAGRAAIWALAPPFVGGWCCFYSRFTAILLAAPGSVIRGPDQLLWQVFWLSQSQFLPDPSGGGLEVSAAELVRHLVTTGQAVQVGIDIKPGSFPNSINHGNSRGRIAVAILSTSIFNAPALVDASSLTFGRTGDEQSLDFCNPSSEDANGDGLPDLVCHFLTQLTGFMPADTVGVLKGRMHDSARIEGRDSVRIVGGGRQTL